MAAVTRGPSLKRGHPHPPVELLGAQQPIIIDETTGQGLPVHLYVIWDDWLPLGSIERSEVIMDAYEQVHGRGGAVHVTVAMGLTPVEADRLGIRYQ